MTFPRGRTPVEHGRTTYVARLCRELWCRITRERLVQFSRNGYALDPEKNLYKMSGTSPISKNIMSFGVPEADRIRFSKVRVIGGASVGMVWAAL